MRIESIKIKNFKSFRDADMSNIPQFCVIVGANGSGKSTLFDVFGFLKDCLTFNVKKALDARGGFREVITRSAGKGELIGIEIQFRMEILQVERLVTYLMQIGLDGGQPVVVREILRYKRSSRGSPYHFLDFHTGSGYAITNEEDFNKPDEELDREEQSVEAGVLAIKGLGQFARFKAANAFRQLIENWHVSDFHINLARGSKESIGEYEHLSVTGDNLQRVAYHLQESDPKQFDKIIDAVKRRVPGVRDIKTDQTIDGRLVLNFQDDAFVDPFIDRYVSDGTIKIFAYLILLYNPKPHPLLCIEGPENQLYPTLLWGLAEEFRTYAERGGQVFVSSHSPDFLNAIEVGEVYWLVKEDGCTTIKRAQEDGQIRAFMDEGDKMGYLWKEGFFDKASPQ